MQTGNVGCQKKLLSNCNHQFLRMCGWWRDQSSGLPSLQFIMSSFHRQGDVQRMLHGHLEAVHLMPFDLYFMCELHMKRWRRKRREWAMILIWLSMWMHRLLPGDIIKIQSSAFSVFTVVIFERHFKSHIHASPLNGMYLQRMHNTKEVPCAAYMISNTKMWNEA